MRHSKLTIVLFNTVFVFLMALPALAHKVNIFAYAEDGIIYTEAYFPDGLPVKNGGVEVFDSSDKKIFTGTSDAEGKLSFPIPAHDDLKIFIIASMGHKNSFILHKDEIE